MNRVAVAVGLTALLFVPLIVVGGASPVASPSVTGPDTVSFHDTGTFEATIPTQGDAELENVRLEFVDLETNGTATVELVEEGDSVTAEPVWPTPPWDSDRDRAGWRPPWDRDRGAASDRAAANGLGDGEPRSERAAFAFGGVDAAGDDRPRASDAGFRSANVRQALQRVAAFRWALWVDAPWINEYQVLRSFEVTATESPPGAGYGYGYGYGSDGDATVRAYEFSFDGHAFAPGREYGVRVNATTAAGEHFTSDLAEFEVTFRDD